MSHPVRVRNPVTHHFEAQDPDGVIIDVDLGHGINGFDLADAFRRCSPALAVVFLTHIPNARFHTRSKAPIPKGAAYLRKDQLNDKDILLKAVEAALSGTQAAVMHLIAQGRTTKEIAAIRGTSMRTVRDVITRSRTNMAASQHSETQTPDQE